MFSSRKDDRGPAPIPPAAMQASTGTRRPRSSAAPSIISSDLTVNGNLTSTGDIQIDGRIEGDVNSAGLVIGEKALIHGDVMAEEVTVRGRVQGSIRARKVLLASTCHVEGNILHEAFAVETGAFFEGNCRHADNPLGEEAPKKPEFHAVQPPAAPAAAAPHAAPPRPAAPSTPTASFTPLKSN